ncbi:hypothetical protein ACFQZR_12420 [Paenibacillus sp. GCM10027629]|uniref:hypothetical protein n=1 Tax=Paenibacillus sp. GCM10027629 TaxID=3273414 RepID=UPI0036337698
MGKSIVLFVLFSFLLMGCSTNNPQMSDLNEQNLNLHLSKPEGQNYNVYKKVEDNETVKTVMDVLGNVQWENAKVSMSREPDYKINTINIDLTVSYEPVTYAFWISPKKDILEVIIEGQSKYGKLTKKDSAILYSLF